MAADEPERRSRVGRLLRHPLLGWLAVAAVVGFGLIQLVPYGRDHDNPPVTAEPAWDSPQTRELVHAACIDCHGNETRWPWYANVAPMSWLLQSDVDRGRDELNFSRWDDEDARESGEDIVESILDGDMPPARYLPLHPEARLDPAEQQALVDGIVATLGLDDDDNDD